MKAIKQIGLLLAVMAFVLPARLHADLGDTANEAKKDIKNWADDAKEDISETFSSSGYNEEVWNSTDKKQVEKAAKNHLNTLDKQYTDLRKRSNEAKVQQMDAAWNASIETKKKMAEDANAEFKKSAADNWQYGKDQLRDALKNYNDELMKVAKRDLSEKEAFEWQVQASLLSADEHIDALKKEAKQAEDPKKQDVEKQIRTLEDNKGRVEAKFKKLQSTASDENWNALKQDIKSDMRGLDAAGMV